VTDVPTSAELQALVQRISERIGRQMERKGLLARDAESSYLALEPGGEEGALADLQGHSITYRIALGPHKGRKAFLLQSLAPRGEERAGECVAQANGFSLHAGIAAEAERRQKLERLCRYIARPAVAIERLSRTAQGTIRYALKTPYRDGTTHVIFEPLDFLARLASLVPSPRVNLTRYHGVFAPNHCLRARIVPARSLHTTRVNRQSTATRSNPAFCGDHGLRAPGVEDLPDAPGAAARDLGFAPLLSPLNA
jgi:hypothetical protein